MSLFPAYTAEGKVGSTSQQTTSTAPQDSSDHWLENTSYAVPELAIKVRTEEANILESVSSDSSTSVSTREKKREQSRRPKKKSKKRKQDSPEAPEKVLEFANEEYYVDKAPAQQYKTIRTLHKPACPRYRRQYQRSLGWSYGQSSGVGNATLKSSVRYYRQEKGGKKIEPSTETLEENEYTLQLGLLNRKTMEAPGELQPWLDLIQLQQRNPYKWSRLMLAEKRLDLVQRALVYHPRCEQLYRLYIDTANSTYPSFEISKMFDRLLAKDPYNYTLWTAQIMTTQGSMARCIVPDVLRIYERCMQKMHHAQKPAQVGNESSSDEVMLKLFNNCALFLRQAGLYEQFIALVKLALELNVSTEQFGDFSPLETDQSTLIEYEELILQSGLPMNEIWLRIEKLRQGFNFLPCPATVSCADPQRIVFNEDVCHYIYPLKSRDNSFYLMLLILRLLKVPFVQCDGLAAKFCARVEDIGDSDAIEDVLAACLRRTFALPQQQEDEFLESLYELSKEMAVSPTFLSNTIGHEIYTRCLSEFLMNCATAHAGTDERKRIIFILLWCRLERMLLVLQKCTKKLSADYVKAGRSRFKTLLKKTPNRNVLNFYTEFAIYEYEALESTVNNLDSVRNIFENIIAANSGDETLSSDLCHIYVVYAEILIGRGFREEAVQVLASYALSVDIRNMASIGTAKKLAALQQISEKLESVIAVERNVEIMILEQYLLPDYTVSLLKMCMLFQCLIGQKLEALSYLEKLLNTFQRQDSDRHSFLRENIQELYATALQLVLPTQNCAVTNTLVATKLFAALNEYPRNLFLLQRCGMLSAAPWYKIRATILRGNPTILSVVFLIAAARYRFIQSNCPENNELSAAISVWDKKHTELAVRNRILNLFQMLTPNAKYQGQEQQQKYNALQRNGLFWRFYLRCLSDQCTAFETSKKCLLSALDECPWSKALYLDGATYVPQELSHLQDLIIEKQLRIYALPEELAILRQN